MIAIGNHFGGPEQRGTPIQLALTRASVIAIKERDLAYKDGADAWINPIFIIPGSVSQPDFAGYKLGHFSKKQKGLVIEIAVPQSVADGEGVSEFIVGALREAVRLASAHFVSKGIGFSTLKAEKIILAIEAGLAA